jgi:hypothetical protein
VTSGGRVLVGLILSATVAFAVGVVLERHAGHNEAAEAPTQRAAESAAQRAGENATGGTTSQRSGSGESGESGENAGHTESGESGESATPEATSQSNAKSASESTTTEATKRSESSEKLLGVNPEATGLLVVAVVVSLLLAGAVWRLGASSLVLGAVALSMAAFGALDVREVAHQANESHTGLMVLAALVAVLHLAAAALAARAAVAVRENGPPPASARAS